MAKTKKKKKGKKKPKPMGGIGVPEKDVDLNGTLQEENPDPTL